MIVGQRDGEGRQLLGDQDFRIILARLAAAPATPDFAYATCGDPQQLPTIIERVGGRDIDLLDIYYHGSKGTLWLGGGSDQHRLFASDATSSLLFGREYARALRPLLRAHAHVRLLGCDVGVGMEGRMLLLKLAYELGGSCVAFAPILDIIPGHFSTDTGRFTTPAYLFSSLGALDREAPSKDERDFETPKYP
jgi:hypothetical protein